MSTEVATIPQSTAVATTPAAAPVAHSSGVQTSSTQTSGSPAQQLAAFAKSLGLGVAPAEPATLPVPSKGAPWSYIDEHGIRTLSLDAQNLQSQLRTEFRALTVKEQKSPRVRADYATALAKLYADDHGELSAEQFAASTLSGYRLPPGKYVPETIQHLAMACAAMLTQSQVETAVRNLRAWS